MAIFTLPSLIAVSAAQSTLATDLGGTDSLAMQIGTDLISPRFSTQCNRL